MTKILSVIFLSIILFQKTTLAESPFGSLNPNNPFSEVSSPFGSLNPNNPFSEGDLSILGIPGLGN